MVKQTTHTRWSLSSILRRPTITKYSTMKQNKQPVEQYYYSEQEWGRLGCGPLPKERDREQQQKDAHQRVVAKGNPLVDGKNIKGYN